MGGAIPGGEGGGFPVIYIEGAFTDLANRSGNMWTCARTIIHEFSHHEIKTADHKYRHQGLKPDKTKALWEFEWVQKVIFKQQVEHGLKVFSP